MTRQGKTERPEVQIGNLDIKAVTLGIQKAGDEVDSRRENTQHLLSEQQNLFTMKQKITKTKVTKRSHVLFKHIPCGCL